MRVFIDYNKSGGQSCLLDGKSSQPLSKGLEWMYGDKEGLEIFFRTPNGTGQASTAVDIGDRVLLVAAKNDLDDADLDLFDEDGFTAEDSGDDLHYLNGLAIESSELLEDLDAAADHKVKIFVDLRMNKPDNSEIRTFRFPVIVNKRVYNGEASPDPATPIYPPPGSLITTSMLVLPAGKKLVVADDLTMTLEDI